MRFCVARLFSEISNDVLAFPVDDELETYIRGIQKTAKLVADLPNAPGSMTWPNELRGRFLTLKSDDDGIETLLDNAKSDWIVIEVPVESIGDWAPEGLEESDGLEDSYLTLTKGDTEAFGIHVYLRGDGSEHINSPPIDIEQLLKTEPVYVFGLEEGNSPGY